MSLVDVFHEHSRVLSAKSSALEVIHHAGDRGAEREDLLSKFLQPLLPERIGIGRGEVKASDGNWSRQEDLILYDKLDCPRLFVGSRSQVFPIESVGAVIEVKTSLGSKEIEDATNNISQLKRLTKSGMSTRVGAGSISFGLPTPVLGCLFSYNLNLQDETFTKKWVEVQLALPPQERINLVCILNHTTIIYVDNVFHLWDNSNANLVNSIMFLETGENTLITFTLDLLRALAETRFGISDIFKYYLSGEKELNFPIKYFGKK